MTVSSWSFFSQTCPHPASSNSSITTQVFFSWLWLLWRFLLAGFCSGKLWLSISSLSVSTSLPCDLTSLMDLKRIIDFLVCPTFYALLWWSTFKLLTWQTENQKCVQINYRITTTKSWNVYWDYIESTKKKTYSDSFIIVIPPIHEYFIHLL